MISTPFNLKSISQNLATVENLKIDFFPTIDSTNLFLKNSPHQKNKIALCVADCQIKGKGRLGNQWISPPNCNLYFSLKLSINTKINKLSSITIITALSIAKTLNESPFDFPIKIKWPNDLFINDSKVGGILTEICKINDNTYNLIIGVGLNVNLAQNTQLKLDKNWISLATFKNKNLDRNVLLKFIINNLISEIKLFKHSLMKEDLSKEFKQYNYLFNKKISFKYNHKILDGFCQGIDNKGNLIIMRSGGQIINLHSGEAKLIY